MSLFITGGTGFFGRALLRAKLNHALAWNDFSEVTVLSRDPFRFQTNYPEFSGLPWLKFHQGDILKPESLPLSARFTHIIHAATDSTSGQKLTPMQRYDQIVLGTRNILNFAVKSNVDRFLLTSSGGVYGKLPKGMYMVNENHHGMPDPLDAANVYGVAKREAEHLCALYKETYGLDYVVARCFAFVGQDLPLNVHFAIGNFIYDALYTDCIKVKGDGTAMRSYMAQQDLATWLLKLLQKGQTTNAYNVGSDEAVYIRDLAYLVRDILSPGKEVHILKGAANSVSNIYIPDISKARSELDLQVSVPLKKAILETAKVLENIR